MLFKTFCERLLKGTANKSEEGRGDAQVPCVQPTSLWTRGLHRVSSLFQNSVEKEEKLYAQTAASLDMTKLQSDPV